MKSILNERTVILLQKFLILSKKEDLEYTENFSNLCEVYFRHLKRKFHRKYSLEVIISENFILNLIYPLNTLKFEESKSIILEKLLNTKINGLYIKDYRNGENLITDFKEFLNYSSSVNLDTSSFEGANFVITVRKNTLEISRLIF